MLRIGLLGVCALAACLIASPRDAFAQSEKLTTQTSDPRSPLALQIALGRLRFSPGVIDGKMGLNTEKAVKAFQRSHKLSETGRPDDALWQKLDSALSEPLLVDYEIADEDVSGPFAKEIPDDLEEQAKLDRLSYTGPEELLAEKFHMDVDFLKRLNEGKRLDQAGTTIKVVNIERPEPPKAERVEVNKEVGGVLAFDQDESIVAFFPATIGSDETPSPSGKFKVVGIAEDPVYTYDPAKLDFKGVEAKQAFQIQPGPNNPVGLVWIDLNEPGYGIHGTPEPAAIGRDSSHGCVRLTNWDALDLAKMVRTDVPVEFTGKG